MQARYALALSVVSLALANAGGCRSDGAADDPGGAGGRDTGGGSPGGGGSAGSGQTGGGGGGMAGGPGGSGPMAGGGAAGGSAGGEAGRVGALDAGAADARTSAPDSSAAGGNTACTGSLYATDFEEASDAGWTHKLLVAKLGDPWVRGTSAAPTCHQGNKCWTTGLSGPYAACIEGELVSPVIDLSGCAANAAVRVSFWQWQEIEGFAENRYFDGAFVQISKDAGSTWDSLPVSANLDPPYLGVSGVYDQCPAFLAPLSGQKIWADKVNNMWRQAHLDVPAGYLNSQFRVRFVFGADIHDGGRGWILDEFAVARR